MLTFHREMNPGGGQITKCVVPSCQAGLSFYTTCPIALYYTRSPARRRSGVGMIEITRHRMKGSTMSLPLKPLTTTMIGGITFLLPLIVVLALLGQGLALVSGIAAPLAAYLPERQIGGVAAVTLVGLVLILLMCYGAGLLARAALGRALSEKFENRLHALYPRYTVIKAMTQGLGATTGSSALKPVLVSFDDHQLLALEVERLADGRVVVFLPGAPDIWSGSVVLVPPERVAGVSIGVGALDRSLKRLGGGTAALLNPSPGLPTSSPSSS